MNIYVDIDNTVCRTDDAHGIRKYELSTPITDKISHINRLYDEGNRITYWTARGNASGIDYAELTRSQLAAWGCKYHELKMGGKPSYDLLIDDKTQHPDSIVCTGERKITPAVVPKGWGCEIVFVNNDKYCGKILRFNAGAKFSMHYHLIKKETWYVASGKFVFKYINTHTADIHELELNVGDTVTNEVGAPHQIICIDAGDIFEVSTTHYDSDSYRVMKGDSQHSCDSC